MEYLNEYLQRLDKVILENSNNIEVLEFLMAYRRSIEPKQYHSCDDINCIICGSGM